MGVESATDAPTSEMDFLNSVKVGRSYIGCNGNVNKSVSTENTSAKLDDVFCHFTFKNSSSFFTFPL